MGVQTNCIRDNNKPGDKAPVSSLSGSHLLSGAAAGRPCAVGVSGALWCGNEEIHCQGFRMPMPLIDWESVLWPRHSLRAKNKLSTDPGVTIMNFYCSDGLDTAPDASWWYVWHVLYCVWASTGNHEPISLLSAPDHRGDLESNHPLEICKPVSNAATSVTFKDTSGRLWTLERDLQKIWDTFIKT